MHASISPIAQVPPRASELASPSAAAPTEGFARLFEQGMVKVDAELRSAEGALSDLATGKPVELHEVMLRMEQARIGVQTFIQIRNKVLESYQDLMRMQM